MNLKKNCLRLRVEAEAGAGVDVPVGVQAWGWNVPPRRVRSNPEVCARPFHRWGGWVEAAAEAENRIE